LEKSTSYEAPQYTVFILFLRDQFQYYIPIYAQDLQVTFLPFKKDKASLNDLRLVNTNISDHNYSDHFEETEGFPGSALMELSLLLVVCKSKVLLKGSQA
jgi:hypothetical protein